MLRTVLAASAAVLLLATAAQAQVAMPSANGSEAQRAAISRLDFMDGQWRGIAVITGPQGRTELVQTERVGSHLGGSIKVIEGRGYDAAGATQFNAMAVVSWDERAGRYGFRSYAQGFQGDYPFEVTEDGFRWSTPAGPNARIEYVATVKDGVWHEVGDYVAEGQPPRRYIEMRLTRVGDTDWPSAGAVPPR